HRDQRNRAQAPADRGDLREALADRGAVQGTAPGPGAGRLSDAAEGRDRQPPARLLPGPPDADPPLPRLRRGTRRTSKDAQAAGPDAAHEHAPPHAARADRRGTDPQVGERRRACQATKETPPTPAGPPTGREGRGVKTAQFE